MPFFLSLLTLAQTGINDVGALWGFIRRLLSRPEAFQGDTVELLNEVVSFIEANVGKLQVVIQRFSLRLILNHL